jgi:hypothetical protein
MSNLSQFFGGSETSIPIEVCLIGGGGGGGCDSTSSPGGGAGQFRYLLINVYKGLQYDVTIGSGGSGGDVGHSPNPPSNGSPTYFGTYFADGGNGYGQPKTFGSTAGAEPGLTPSATILASIQTTDGLSLQNSGNTGFSGNEYDVVTFDPDGPIGGGGGGAGGPQPVVRVGSQFSGTSGNGHLGISLSIIGYPTLRVAGGGGGAGSSTNDSSRGYGVDGGGGGGSRNNPAGNGTANTGGGGGGGHTSYTAFPGGGDGGSGLVIVRYPDIYPAATVNNNATTPAQSGFRVYRWNNSGSITFN